MQQRRTDSEEGHNITIRCEVKGNPEPIITWQKNGGSKLPKTARLTDDNQTLQIANVKLEDSGEYICKAVNNLATSRSAAKVRVTRRLSFTYRQKGTLTADEKNSITLTCLYKDGLSPVSTIWTKDGVKINANKKTRFSTNNQVMELRDLGMEDVGSYKCIIKSHVSQIQNTVNLIVRKLHPNNCSEVRQSGFLQSRFYVIFPKGSPSKPMQVYCDMNSKPGEGITQFKTCSDIRKAGHLKSGSHQINPTGDSSQPMQVYCDMDSKPGEGLTVISHDSEARSRLQGVNIGSYKKSIRYQLTQPQIQAIIQNSKKCVQFIKFECFESDLSGYTWWVSAKGQRMKNWGGAGHTVNGCACSLTNSCAGGKTCNCNKNDRVWRVDSGYLDEKEFLPVKELWFGDLDDPHEDSYYTLGKLKCY